MTLHSRTGKSDDASGRDDCPVLESWWDNSFSFPWWCGMDDETIDYLVNSLKAGIAKLKE